MLDEPPFIVRREYELRGASEMLACAAKSTGLAEPFNELSACRESLTLCELVWLVVAYRLHVTDIQRLKGIDSCIVSRRMTSTRAIGLFNFG